MISKGVIGTGKRIHEQVLPVLDDAIELLHFTIGLLDAAEHKMVKVTSAEIQIGPKLSNSLSGIFADGSIQK